MQKIIKRKIYDTATATLLASDRFWDGSNWERNGRNCYLYRTPTGAYFRHDTTCWQGERDQITPLTKAEALDLYEELPEQDADFTEAFPGEQLSEA